MEGHGPLYKRDRRLHPLLEEHQADLQDRPYPWHRGQIREHPSTYCLLFHPRHPSGFGDVVWMIRLGNSAWMDDGGIAVGQSPALSQSHVFNFEMADCGALHIKGELILVMPLGGSVV